MPTKQGGLSQAHRPTAAITGAGVSIGGHFYGFHRRVAELRKEVDCICGGRYPY